jgi:DNA-binding transcriptional LysR family regulator
MATNNASTTLRYEGRQPMEPGRDHADGFSWTSIAKTRFMTLVRSGLGATILPRCVLSGRRDDDSLRFLRLRNAYLRRDVGVALLKDEIHLPLVDMAIELCRQHFHANHSSHEAMVSSSR